MLVLFEINTVALAHEGYLETSSCGRTKINLDDATRALALAMVLGDKIGNLIFLYIHEIVTSP